MGVRAADKAGQWYRADSRGLAAEVDWAVDEAARLYGACHPLPGTSPVAAVVPHAGLQFSGPIAATAFRLLREAV